MMIERWGEVDISTDFALARCRTRLDPGYAVQAAQGSCKYPCSSHPSKASGQFPPVVTQDVMDDQLQAIVRPDLRARV